MIFIRFQPFLDINLQNVGQVLVIVFWAYAGFELATLPADEIQDAKKTIPRALTVGMLIAALIYMVTNFVVIGVVDQSTLASSEAPLVVAAANILSFSPVLAWIGSLVVGVGAMISIMGADESGTLGTARLTFAMSIDGYLPQVFSRLHKSYHTPYIGLAVLCSTAFIASLVNTLSALVNSSVFLLSIAYLATGISALLLERKHLRSSPKGMWTILIPALAVIFSIILMSQVTRQQILISLALLAVGVPVYTFFSPKKELTELEGEFLSEEAILERTYRQEKTFMAYLLYRIKLLIYRIKGVEKEWNIQEEPES
jgi:amino acid transporter